MVVPKQLSITPNVQYVGPSDELSSSSITRVDAALAARDVAIANQLSMVVTYLTNTYPLISLPIPRVSLPALGSLPIANFRIPANTEACVLNASVASNPTGNTVSIEVFYSPTTFGTDGTNSHGATLVNTASEYKGISSFVGTGELVVVLTNQATVPVEIVGSVLIALKSLV